MVILSYEFTLLFLLFFCLYWACRRSIKVQNYLLILAGLAFIASWNYQFLISILIIWQSTQIGAYIVSNYANNDTSNEVDNNKNKTIRLVGFFGAIAIILGHLCYFKYSNFFITEINETGLFTGGLTPLDIVLPLGVSFYSFQAISYLYDVYHDKMEPLPAPVLLGILTFIPSLTAGPIFRPKDAEHQWMGADYYDYYDESDDESDDENQNTKSIKKTSKVKARVTDIETINEDTQTRNIIQPYLAGALIIFALSKKIVLAGWLESIWVTPVFANPLQFNGLEVLTAIYAYSLQLFFDFSGYTDLAIALALLLGFRIPENFRQPYLATDIQDFWGRWHMTLSHWIRDYLYIPLGGNRNTFFRVQLNVMVAFVLSGIWHGAGWNFFIWGAIHGVALVWLNLMDEYGYRYELTKKSPAFANFITFNYVAFSWIFFHSKTYEQAISMLQGLVHFEGNPFKLPALITLTIMGIAWLVYPYLSNSREILANQLRKLPWWSLALVFSLYVLLVFSIAPAGLPGFIYANF